jgi:AcrR family transcriptional regulator
MATDTRQRILERALELFITHGVAGTTVVMIEDAAGLSPGSGSFYRHFPDKEAVLRAIVERELVRVVGEREARVTSSQGLADDLHGAMQGLDRMSGLIQLLAREGTSHPTLFDPVRTVLAEEGARIEAGRLRERMDRGELRDGDATAVASVVIYALVGFHLAHEFFGAPVGVDRDHFIDAIVDLLAPCE